MPSKEKVLVNNFGNLYAIAETGKLSLDAVKNFIATNKIDINLSISITTKSRKDPAKFTLLELAILYAEKQKDKQALFHIIEFLLSNGASPIVTNPAFSSKPIEKDKSKLTSGNALFYVFTRLSIDVFKEISYLILKLSNIAIDFNSSVILEEKPYSLLKALFEHGNFDILNYIILTSNERKDKILIDIFAQDETGAFLIHKLIKKSNPIDRINILNLVLEADASRQQFYEDTLLIACKNDWQEVVSYFLRQKRNSKLSFDINNIKGISLLDFTLEHSKITLLRLLLLEMLTSPHENIFNQTRNSVQTASYILALNDIKLVELLEKKHGDIFPRLTETDLLYLFYHEIVPILNNDNERQLATFLQQAANKYKLEQIKKFLIVKLPFHAAKASILTLCVKSVSIECISHLLKLGIDVNNPATDLNLTPLHVAINEDRFDVFNLLLENAANIHLETVNGATPLYTAAFKKRLSFVEKLISFDSTVCSVRNKYNRTVLDELIVSNSDLDISIVDNIFKHTTIEDRQSAINYAISLQRKQSIIYFIQNCPNIYFPAFRMVTAEQHKKILEENKTNNNSASFNRNPTPLLLNNLNNNIVTTSHSSRPIEQQSTQPKLEYPIIYKTEVSDNLHQYLESLEGELAVFSSLIFYLCIWQFDKNLVKLLLDNAGTNINQPLLIVSEDKIAIPKIIKDELDSITKISLLQFAIELNNTFILKQIIQKRLATPEQTEKALQLIKTEAVNDNIKLMVESAFPNNVTATSFADKKSVQNEPIKITAAKPEVFSAISYLRSLGFSAEKIKELKAMHSNATNSVNINLNFLTHKPVYSWFNHRLTYEQAALVSTTYQLYHINLSDNYFAENFSETIAANIKKKSRLRIAKSIADEGFVPVNFSKAIYLNIEIDNNITKCLVTHKLKFLNNLERLVYVSIPSDNEYGQGKLMIPLLYIPASQHDKLEEFLISKAKSFLININEILNGMQENVQNFANISNINTIKLTS